ncbi:hypothetical protein COCHEDRAFT_1154795 [Bipolaris maydis C5]|uniref:Uncharacterized protein n=1 Tax=Cochliobolus heterostrophus (strain C5 / ATCC 48332 / race O) TaxID=701091 RepID=M2UZE3_COCH5|nr:hypothetical protein COCHEDRAFT_1154795 [Bipolaris maydis C5]
MRGSGDWCRVFACRHDIGSYMKWPTYSPKDANTGCLIHGGQARPGNMGQSGNVCNGLADCPQVGAHEAYSDGFGKESWVELLDTHGLGLASTWTWAGAGSFFTIDCHFEVVILSRSLKRVWSDGDGFPSR